MTQASQPSHVIVIGAGFCGLAAGYELSRHGIRVTVLEKDEEIGGLAGSFLINGVAIERFYHHWFTNDQHISTLVYDLGVEDRIVMRPTHTGMYYANNFFKLSTPLDLLRFTPLTFIERIKLGLFTLRVRRINNWRDLEHLTAEQWLRGMCGDKIYDVVWGPLLQGKFGEYAHDVSAVWFWNKLKLRGGSRGKRGEEQLAYFRGGFSALAMELAKCIRSQGGEVHTGVCVKNLVIRNSRIIGVETLGKQIDGDAVIATTALPVFANLVERHVPDEYVTTLRKIKYLANICLVLELNRSLSGTYWINVNEPDFPFVGVIEHTNFEPSKTYGGVHIAYLSKYLLPSDPLFVMSGSELLDFTVPHLQRMFPEFRREWIRGYYVWRADYSQPLVGCHYSSLIPPVTTPINGLFLATMAQIYPEDRGTNYAVREGRKVACLVVEHLRTVLHKTV